MVFRPGGGTGPAQLIVLGSSSWTPIHSTRGSGAGGCPSDGGALGTAVASGDTLFVSTLSSSEPSMPTFDAALQQYDKNTIIGSPFRSSAATKIWGTLRLDRHRFRQRHHRGNGTRRELGSVEYGAIALRPEKARATGCKGARRFKTVHGPVVYKGVFYMVKDGGISHRSILRRTTSEAG